MDENKELVETMEDYAEELEASFKRLHEGDIVTGTVVAVTDDQVLVDLKYFAQGVIDRENLSNDPDFNMKEEIQPGDLLTATVIQTDDGEGNVVLSCKEANDRMTWEHFRQLLDERTPLEVTISEVVNGRCGCDGGRRARLYTGVETGCSVCRGSGQLEWKEDSGAGD